MKKLLMLFGLLDIISIIRSYEPITLLLTNLTDLYWLQLLNLALFILLGLSAYFLLNQRKAGLWLAYGQFPLRLGFMVLSFGFLFSLHNILGGHGDTHKILAWILMGFEFVRLFITILIHKKFYTGTTPSLT